MKTQGFFKNLLLLVVLVSLCKGLLRILDEHTWTLVVDQVLNALYLFTPAIAVLIVEKWKFRPLVSEYQVTLKNRPAGKIVKYLFLTSIVLPAFMLGVIFVFGNLLGIESFGRIWTDGSYTFHGVDLPDNLYGRFLLVSVSTIMALLAGLTYNLIFALGGEVAWRGFLEKHLKCSYFKKNLLIGLVWGIWTVPMIIFSGKDGVLDYGCAAGLTIFLCIVSSFFFSNALKETKTLLAPAAMQGIISSLSLSFLLEGGGQESYYLIGGYGVLMSLSIVMITVGFTKKLQAK